MPRKMRVDLSACSKSSAAFFANFALVTPTPLELITGSNLLIFLFFKKQDGVSPMGKKIIIIAGPNGVGKTTFARSFLPAEAGCLRFINADLIAAGLSPFAPEIAAIKAGRLMLQEIAQSVAQGQSFALETTLSGLAYLRHIHEWRGLGYHVSLFFLTLPSPEAAIARVAERVKQGGHNIPEAVIRRRFAAGLQNFEAHYRHVVDTWVCYDNAGDKPIMMTWEE